MKKMNILLKLSLKFAMKYLKGYLYSLVKPLCAFLGGVLVLVFCINIPQIALLGLLSLPLFFFGFWRGFMVTYALNLASCTFTKQSSSLDFAEYYNLSLKDEKELAKWVTFCAITSIALYCPTILFVLNSPNIIKSMPQVFIVFLINTLLLAPFLNYFTQAFFFRKKDENYFDLFLNCYKKLDSTGILIALIITIGMMLVSSTPFYAIIALFANIFIYSINTFWYSSRS